MITFFEEIICSENHCIDLKKSVFKSQDYIIDELNQHGKFSGRKKNGMIF